MPPDSCPVVAVMNQKGGVGKTATSVTLAAEAARRGLAVLLVDADPQGSATEQLFPETLPAEGLGHVLSGEADLVSAAATARAAGDLGDGSGRLDVLAGDDTLLAVEVSLAIEPDAWMLSRGLEGVRASGAYDLIVIDGGPGVGGLVANLIVSADLVICPVSLSSTSVRGVGRLRQLTTDASAALGVSPRVVYLPTVADRRLSETAEILGALGGFGSFPGGDLLPAIRTSTRMSKAYGQGLTIQELDASDRAAEDYAAVYDLLAAAGLVPSGPSLTTAAA